MHFRRVSEEGERDEQLQLPVREGVLCQAPPPRDPPLLIRLQDGGEEDPTGQQPRHHRP